MWPIAKAFGVSLAILGLCYKVSCLNTGCQVKDEELRRAPYKLENSQARLTIFEKGQLWPEGQVYFNLDQRLSNEQIFLVYEAFSEFHRKTCIRFRPWKWGSNTTHNNYITITAATDPGTCSLSEVCMKGDGQQLVQLGGLCWFKEMVLHQLGHTLCLGHEHQRPVRDLYLTYRHTCPKPEIPSISDASEASLGFYDYASQMHFACGWCSGGWPRNESETTKCGYQVTKGLSLLDADYINLLYGCGGCHRHRWIPVDHLTTVHKQHMYNFGMVDRLGHELYPCRVSFQGEIAIGKFTWHQRICSFSLGGLEYYQTGMGTEVLLIPGGLRSKDGTSEYRVEDVGSYSPDMLLKVLVPAGRLSERENLGMGFVAFGKARSPASWEYEDTIGKAWERDGKIKEAYFPLGGKEVGAYQYKLLTCHSNEDVSVIKANTSHF